ncbi:peptidase A4 family-domain-containing protein [Xylariales sp. PMI_506]|nr:peptidase A4 family-domain-containing protein [Xylariales sp. PMI_506]
MKLSVVIISALAYARAATGARFTEIRRERAAERTLHNRSANVLRTLGGNRQRQVSYDDNWGGAVQTGTGYKSVTGTFVVPTPSTVRTGFEATIWVGLDGYNSESDILQTGIDIYFLGDELAFDAWYEWYPDYAYDFTGITISAGDTISATITATSTTSAVAVIANESTGKSVSHIFSGELYPLKELNAEWIAEELGTSLASFGEFSVTFTDASATSSKGIVGVTGATIIESPGIVVTIDGPNELTVTFE